MLTYLLEDNFFKRGHGGRGVQIWVKIIDFCIFYMDSRLIIGNPIRTADNSIRISIECIKINDFDPICAAAVVGTPPPPPRATPTSLTCIGDTRMLFGEHHDKNVNMYERYAQAVNQTACAYLLYMFTFLLEPLVLLTNLFNVHVFA